MIRGLWRPLLAVAVAFTCCSAVWTTIDGRPLSGAAIFALVVWSAIGALSLLTETADSPGRRSRE